MTTGISGAATASADLLAAALAGLGAPHPGTLVVGPPDERPGSWAGAPCALTVDGTVWLAYRLRRPVEDGRGYANVIARSADGHVLVPKVTADVRSSKSLTGESFADWLDPHRLTRGRTCRPTARSARPTAASTDPWAG